MTATKKPTTNEVISRAEAKARGLKHYFTGKPCPKGHVDYRHTSGGACVACKKQWAADNSEYWKTRYWEAPDAARQRSKAWRNATGYDAARYHANKEAERERADKYREQNKCKVLASRRERRNKDLLLSRAKEKAARDAKPHVHIAYNQKRRAARLNATPSWYGELDDLVMVEAADLCKLRERATGFAWHVDHMVPLMARTACGLHCAANLQVIPAALNMQKKNKLHLTEPHQWLKRI